MQENCWARAVLRCGWNIKHLLTIHYIIRLCPTWDTVLCDWELLAGGEAGPGGGPAWGYPAPGLPGRQEERKPWVELD